MKNQKNICWYMHFSLHYVYVCVCLCQIKRCNSVCNCNDDALYSTFEQNYLLTNTSRQNEEDTSLLAAFRNNTQILFYFIICKCMNSS